LARAGRPNAGRSLQHARRLKHELTEPKKKAGLVKKAAMIFLFLIVNGTWALIGYLLHIAGLRPGVIAVVLGAGILGGNLASYAGVKFAGKLLRKNVSGNSD
jgi:hypothetical protein